MSETLKNKAVSGVGWSLLDNIANYGITFIVGIVLARLLTPDEYGLIGIITIFIAVFNIIVDSGFSTALIRKKDVGEADYCTVFYINLLVSILLAALLFFSAPAISSFFEREELTSLAKVMSSIVLINALSIVQKTRLTKALDFKTQTKISIIAHVLSGGIGIGLAIVGYGVWALVAQQVSSRLFTTLLLWVYNRWMPKLLFSVSSLKSLWGFSWKLLLAQVINTVWQQIYQVVISKFYQPSTLGQYTRARQFSDIFSSNLTTVIRKVTFPVLSSIQDDKARLLTAYRRIIKDTMYVTFILLFSLAAVSEPLILVLIGDKWLPCVGFLKILCFTVILYPIEALNINMITVLGRSDRLLMLEIIQKVIAVIPIIIGVFCGIYWMLLGSMVASWINYLIVSHFSGKDIGYPTKEQIKDISPSFILAIGVVIPVWLCCFLPISRVLVLLVQFVLLSLLVVGASRLFKMNEYIDVVNLLKDYTKKIKQKI